MPSLKPLSCRLLVFLNFFTASGMTCTHCCTSGLLLFHFWGVTSSGQEVLFQDTDKGHNFPVIVLTPWSCRELIFSTCSYESDQTFCVLFDGSTGSTCTFVCVYLLQVCLCTLVCAFVFSMLDKCEETRTRCLQRGLF